MPCRFLKNSVESILILYDYCKNVEPANDSPAPLSLWNTFSIDSCVLSVSPRHHRQCLHHLHSWFQNPVVEVVGLGVNRRVRFAVSHVKHGAFAVLQVVAEILGGAPDLVHGADGKREAGSAGEDLCRSGGGVPCFREGVADGGR